MLSRVLFILFSNLRECKDEGIIVNGYIKEPNLLLKQLIMIFKEGKLRPYRVRFILNDQNFIVRDFKINKTDLEKSNINDIVINQLGKSLHIPYAEVGIDTTVRVEDEAKLDVLAILTDLNLLHDYHDVFDKLGIKEVDYDIASYGFLKVYELTKGYIPMVSMHVAFHDKQIVIQVFEREMLVFNFIEEIDLHQINFNQMVEAYVERVANYYQYNLKRSKARVNEIIFYNFNQDLDKDRLGQIIANIDTYKTINFDLDNYQENINLFPLITHLPFYAMQSAKVREKGVSFDVKRLKLIDFVANYILILALFIFGFISIVLIPYLTSEVEIKNDQNYNQALVIERDELIKNKVILPRPDSSVVSYNEAYEKINGETNSITEYLLALVQKAVFVDITNYQVNQKTREIVIYITGDTMSLYEYSIDIYESFGDIDNGGFILSKPINRLVNDTIMEVRVNYA